MYQIKIKLLELPLSNNNLSKVQKETTQIFRKIANTSVKKYEEINKISSKSDNYYFTLVKPNFLYLLLIDKIFPEDNVYQLIDKIIKIDLMKYIDKETLELNMNCKTEIKSIIEKYENLKINKNLDESININNEKFNIENINPNNDDNIGLNDKFDTLQNLTSKERNSPTNIKNDKWWQNYIVWIICSIICLIILTIFLVTYS